MQTSATDSIHSPEPVFDLIHKFDLFNDVFMKGFLQYNGTTRTISMTYRVRTYQSFMDEGEYLKNLVIQYLANPIHIPSSLYTVQIYSDKSTKNLAADDRYFLKEKDFWILNLSEICNIDAEIVTIIIDSKIQFDMDAFIGVQISIQPRVIEDRVFEYEIVGILKFGNIPPNFQFLNIPIILNLELNGFIVYFIEQKFLQAADKWFKMERFEVGDIRKKKNYAGMIKNRYKVTPLEFIERRSAILDEILNYIREHYHDIMEVSISDGVIESDTPEGYHSINVEKSIGVKFTFRANLDASNIGTRGWIRLNIKWMRHVFDKYLPTDIPIPTT